MILLICLQNHFIGLPLIVKGKLNKNMYVYGFAGDKTMATKFRGVWESRRNRWKIPDELKEQVVDYIYLVSQSDDDQQPPRRHRSSPRRRKPTHRSESFDSEEDECL